MCGDFPRVMYYNKKYCAKAKQRSGIPGALPPWFRWLAIVAATAASVITAAQNADQNQNDDPVTAAVI